MATKRVLVVGGSPEPAPPALMASLAASCDKVCAVDRGYDALRAAVIEPDLFCGDCDSLSREGSTALQRLLGSGACEVERYNPDKDFTDLDLALRAVRDRWAGADAIVTCISGGRPDHFLAAMGRLASHARDPLSGHVSVRESSYQARVLCQGDAWDIEDAAGSTFSMVPLAPSTGSERGMKWEIDHACCEALSDLGISNVVTSGFARIECHEGIVMAFLID